MSAIIASSLSLVHGQSFVFHCRAVSRPHDAPTPCDKPIGMFRDALFDFFCHT
jgi:hypothetical protein